MTAKPAARMPAEKLLTSISKPGLILPSQIASTFFISHAASGPMIIAPRNIGCDVLMITPMVATTADHATADAVDHPAALHGDQQRQHVPDHRADQAGVRHAVGVARTADRGDRESSPSR